MSEMLATVEMDIIPIRTSVFWIFTVKFYSKFLHSTPSESVV